MRASNKLLIVFALSLSVMAPVAGRAQQKKLDNASEEALDKTKKLLVDPNQRKEAIKRGGEKTVEADNQVNKLTGSAEGTQKVYEISADVMEKITRESGGDAGKMQELLQKAAANPEAFLKSLTPAQQAEIKKLADQISAQQGNKR